MSNLDMQGLALKPLTYLCLTSQGDMEAGAKGRSDSPLVADPLSVLTGKALQSQSLGTLNTS